MKNHRIRISNLIEIKVITETPLISLATIKITYNWFNKSQTTKTPIRTKMRIVWELLAIV